MIFVFWLEAIIFDKSMIFSRLEAVVFNKSRTCDYEKIPISGFLFCWLETIVLNKSMTSAHIFVMITIALVQIRLVAWYLVLVGLLISRR
jgi:hypothetical protein